MFAPFIASDFIDLNRGRLSMIQANGVGTHRRVGATHRLDCPRAGGLHPPYDVSCDPAQGITDRIPKNGLQERRFTLVYKARTLPKECKIGAGQIEVAQG